MSTKLEELATKVNEALSILSQNGVVLENRVKARTATLVRHYRPSPKLGDAALYWLSPPIICNWRAPGGEPLEYVLLATKGGVTEMFPANRDGSALSWSSLCYDLPLNFLSTHKSVLWALGYEITECGGKPTSVNEDTERG